VIALLKEEFAELSADDRTEAHAYEERAEADTERFLRARAVGGLQQAVAEVEADAGGVSLARAWHGHRPITPVKTAVTAARVKLPVWTLLAFCGAAGA
jgi:hypothetical protein